MSYLAPFRRYGDLLAQSIGNFFSGLLCFIMFPLEVRGELHHEETAWSPVKTAWS